MVLESPIASWTRGASKTPTGASTAVTPSAERVANRPTFRIDARIILSIGCPDMVEAELGRFGDKRLADVGNALLASMRSERTLCLPQLAKDRNQFVQFGRFVANPAVTTQEMLASTARLTDQRAAGRHVLAIMDTTDLRFATHEASKRGFGRDANDTCPGLFLHPVLAVDADHGGVIGLVDCVVLNRTEGKVSDHKTRAADEKESRRWLHGAEIAGDRLTTAAAITMVSDRESDIYDLFARRPAHVDLLCRSAHPRAMTTGGLLPAHCAGLPEQGRTTIEVPPKPGRTAREATVALRFDAIELRRPGGAGGEPAKAVALWVVDVSEVDPPNGAEPVHWRLLTTHQVTTLAEAHQIVEWYRRRWIIEQVFRSLKSHGMDIEASQMVEAACFTKLAVIALIAAVGAMQLVLARDGTTGQPVTDAVEPSDMAALRELNTSLQGRTAKLRNPFDEVSLAWYAWIVARLGGWSGYTSRGLQAAGAEDHAPRHDHRRTDPHRMAPGNSFRRCVTPVDWRLKSVRRLHEGIQSFLSIRRMDARRMNASALWLRFSQSFASRRQRPSQPMVRSTIQRLGRTTKPLARSERRTISVTRFGMMFARPSWNTGPA